MNDAELSTAIKRSLDDLNALLRDAHHRGYKIHGLAAIVVNGGPPAISLRIWTETDLLEREQTRAIGVEHA